MAENKDINAETYLKIRRLIQLFDEAEAENKKLKEENEKLRAEIKELKENE